MDNKQIVGPDDIPFLRFVYVWGMALRYNVPMEHDRQTVGALHCNSYLIST